MKVQEQKAGVGIEGGGEEKNDTNKELKECEYEARSIEN